MLKELQDLLDNATEENISSTCQRIIEHKLINTFLPDFFCDGYFS